MEKVQTGEVEVRARNAPVEVRADDEGQARGINGLAIPVGVRADIGPFTEEITPEAVAAIMDDGHDVRGLYNHDANFVLGRVSSGTMTLSVTDQGLGYDIPEMPQSRSDVMEAIQRGDVDGNSFSFTVETEEWDESGEKPHRTIKRFGGLYDVGPVAFPAYEGHTVVSSRAMDHVAIKEEAEAVQAEADKADKADETKKSADPQADRRRKLMLAEAETPAD